MRPIAGSRMRTAVSTQDPPAVRELTSATGFFRPDEVEVAVELVQERIVRGPTSGYEFVFVDTADRMAGYACYGPIACTTSSYDLYWIAVHPDYQGKGIGSALIRETESRIGQAGGQGIYVETSSRPVYEPTRAFYVSRGYVQAALLEDFYAPGDGKVIYVKRLP
jgi:ribosomal protein S18 acetylase RimI-like enzyme